MPHKFHLYLIQYYRRILVLTSLIFCRYSSFNEVSRRRLSSSDSLDNHLDDDSSSSSVIDLLMSLVHLPRSVSTSDLFPDEVDVEDATEEEVHAERSGERDFR